MDLFERFTENARKTVTMAQDEARERGGGKIEVGDILIALCRQAEESEDESLAIKALLTECSVEGTRARMPKYEIEEAEREGGAGSTIPFTESTRKVLENSLREALSLGHNYIGCEHVALAVLRSEWGQDFLDAEKVRRAILERLGHPSVRRAESRRERPRAKPEPGVEDLLGTAREALHLVTGLVDSANKLMGTKGGETEEERLRHVIHDALKILDAEAKVKGDESFAIGARAILRGV